MAASIAGQFGNVSKGLREIDGYDLINLRLALESAEGDWVVALSGKSLADEEYVTAAGDDGFFNFAEVPGTPRSWSVEVTYNWYRVHYQSEQYKAVANRLKWLPYR